MKAKLKNILGIGLLAAGAFGAYADTPEWLNIMLKIGDVGRVVAMPIEDVDSISFRKDPKGDYYSEMVVDASDGRRRQVKMDQVTGYCFGTNVPTITITTDEYVDEIKSKKDYLEADFTMECYGGYDDVETARVNIRGRGNTTWEMPKKPYRLKFDKKISLCGLAKAKNYALIANYIDKTLMRNAIALKIGELLGMPFTNHCIPVNVVLNGKYRGAYMLTEKVGINSGSVDIDEETAILWELDVNYDEDFKFRSDEYGLPVMVKDPDLEEIAEAAGVSADDLLADWRADFEDMERKVKDGTPEEAFDLGSLVDYAIVYSVTNNRELNHPKSTYLYKAKRGDKYTMGPIWDFDWAYNYESRYKDANGVLLGSMTGGKFFAEIFKTPQFRELYAERWREFRDNMYPQLLEFIDSYAEEIRVSALQNGEAWPTDYSNPDSSEKFDENVEELKQWLDKRMKYLDGHENFGLY